MSTSDATGPARMDVLTSQRMLREMITLTGSMFSLLQSHRAPEPEVASPEAPPVPPVAAVVPAGPLPELSAPSIALPAFPDLGAVSDTVTAPPPRAPAPVASIPVPSLPVPVFHESEPEPTPEPAPEAADEAAQPARDGRQSMALMNEIAFLDD